MSDSSPRPGWRPAPGFGGALLWCLAFIFALLFCFVVGAGADFVLQLRDVPAEGRQAWMEGQMPQGQEGELRIGGGLMRAVGVGMATAEVGTVLFAILVLWLAAGSGWWREVALRLPSGEHALLTLLALPAFVIGANVFARLLAWLVRAEAADGGAAEELMREAQKQFSATAMVLVIGLGPGLSEELWCRGFLARGLTARNGYLLGLVLTSMLFGLLHMWPPAYVLTTAVMGLGLHFAYLMTRSLLVPMFLHFGNNSLSVLLARGDIPVKDPVPGADLPGGWLITAVAGVFLLVAVGVAFYVGRARLVPLDSSRPMWEPPYPSPAAPPRGANARYFAPHAGPVAWALVLAGGLLTAAGVWLVVEG